MNPHAAHCPDCAASLYRATSWCPACALPLDGPEAEELWQVDLKLQELEAQRAALTYRRGELLTLLRTRRAQPIAAPRVAAAPKAPAPPTAPPTWPLPAQPDPDPGRAGHGSAGHGHADHGHAEHGPVDHGSPRVRTPRDLSPRAVQNLLLILGGVLVGIAAIVFTIVSWGSLGIGGRAAILLAVTALAMASPWPLKRREADATGEVVASIGLVLILLECYAARHLGLFGLDQVNGFGYAAGVIALVATGWAAYGTIAPLRQTRTAALLLAQLPLPLCATALGPADGLAAALVLTAGLDFAVRSMAARRLEKIVADSAAAIAGVVGTVLALFSSLLAETVGAALPSTAVLLLAAGVGGAYALTLTSRRDAIVAGGAALAFAAGLAAPALPALEQAWPLAAYAIAATVTLALSTLLPDRLLPGAAGVSAAILGLTALAVLPATLNALFWPVGWVGHPWTGAPGGARAALSPNLAWRGPAATPVVWAAVTVATPPLLWRLMRGAAGRSAAWAAGIGLAGLTVAVIPVAADLPYTAAIAVLLGTAAALLIAATVARATLVAGVVGAGGAVVALVAVTWSLAERWASVAAVSVVLGVFAIVAAAARVALVRISAAAAATLAAGGLAWALPLAYGRPASEAAFAVLAVTALALGAATAIQTRRPRESLAVDSAAAVTTVLTVALAGQHRESLALALALSALLGAATAWLRTDQRRDVAMGATGLLAGTALLPLGDALLTALAGPYTWVARPWTDAPETARAALSPFGHWPDHPILAAVLLSVAVAIIATAGRGSGRQGALGAAAVAVPIALVPLPLVVDASYAAGVNFLTALAVALGLVAALSRTSVAIAAGAVATWLATLSSAWSLAERPATLAVVSVVATTGVVCAVLARLEVVRAGAAAVAALAGGGLAAAVTMASGWPPRYAAFAVLGVAGLAVAVGAVLRHRPAVTWALGGSALALWVAAALMAASALPALSALTLVMALGGGVALTTAAGLRGESGGWLLPVAFVAEGLALLPYAGQLLATLFGPYKWLADPWSGAPAAARDALVAGGFVVEPAAAAVAALAVTVAVGGGALVGGKRLASTVAAAAVPVALVPLPTTADLPYVPALAFLGAVAVALSCVAALSRTTSVAVTAGATAGWLATLVTAGSLTSTTPTMVTLSVVVAVGAALTFLARHDHVRAGAGCAATLTAGGLVAAGGLAAGLPGHWAAFGVLGAAALAQLAAALLIHRPATRTASRAVEPAGYLLTAVAIVMTLPHPQLNAGPVSLAIAVAGLIGLGVSLRPDRRQAVWAGAALLQVALWVRLGTAGVDAPEAYTAPVSVVGLVFGWLRHGRSPTVSSWLAYGPALTITLVPSLVAAWDDPGWVRPLLLGLAALALVLAGARLRLQAPLLLGGAALALDAGRELAPTIAQLAGQVPRWVPIAAAGLLLIVVGATYEARLRDLRRLRSAVGQMR